MGASDEMATTHALVVACDHWIAKGGRVTEMEPYGTVHRGHSATSFHYDKDGRYGQAADLNVGAPGAPKSERALMVECQHMFESLGLGVIYDYTGNGVDAARSHRDHGHIDVGWFSNYGDGFVRNTRGSTVVVDTQAALHQADHRRDNILGDLTLADLAVVRNASRFGGERFKEGVTRAQKVVGAKVTNDWDTRSRAAHDATVAALQKVWKRHGLYQGSIGSVWNDGTEAAYRRLLDECGR